jgi:hypothetical protein
MICELSFNQVTGVSPPPFFFPSVSVLVAVGGTYGLGVGVMVGVAEGRSVAVGVLVGIGVLVG